MANLTAISVKNSSFKISHYRLHVAAKSRNKTIETNSKTNKTKIIWDKKTFVASIRTIIIDAIKIIN